MQISPGSTGIGSSSWGPLLGGHQPRTDTGQFNRSQELVAACSSIHAMQAVEQGADLLSKAAHQVVSKKLYVERLADKAVPSFHVVVGLMWQLPDNCSEVVSARELQQVLSTLHCCMVG